MDEIVNCIEAFEDSLYNNRPLDSIADLHSFARWVLAHDYLGTKDAWGSNMYMYRQNLDPLHPETSKLKMATPWDFDSSFTTPDDEWGVPHYAICFYYNINRIFIITIRFINKFIISGSNRIEKIKSIILVINLIYLFFFF